MAHPIFATLKTSLVLRASVATVAAFVFLGIASGALPIGCAMGIGPCHSAPGAVVDPPRPEAEAAQTPPAAPAASAPAAAPEDPIVATLTQNDVLAGTFARLNADLTAPAAIDVGTPASGAVEGQPTPTELTKRVVHTIAIRPDGTPDLGDAGGAGAAQAYADTTRPASAGLDAVDLMGEASRPEAAPPLPLPRPDDAPPPSAKTQPAAKVAAPKAGTHATVGGQGVNVRSSPSVSGSTVLFALSPGEEVTISGDDHGWKHVTDANGRSGWAYEQFLRIQ